MSEQRTEAEEIAAMLPSEVPFTSLADGRETKTPRRNFIDNSANFRLDDRRSANRLKKPRIVHFTMAEMAAVGYSQQEIANFVGYTRETVGKILAQDSMQPAIQAATQRTVQEEMKAFLEQEVMPTLRVLKSVRDNPDARNADRIAAGDKLLDRYLGKAVQPISADAKPVSEQSDEELRTQVEEALKQVNQPN